MPTKKRRGKIREPMHPIVKALLAGAEIEDTDFNMHRLRDCIYFGLGRSLLTNAHIRRARNLLFAALDRRGCFGRDGND